MCRKLSFEEVKSRFEERGYILLETEYKNANTKMRYRCPEHPDKENSIKIGNLSSGKGCVYCARQKPRKYNYESVKKLFEERGYALLESEYKNYETSMRFRCPKHPEKETRMTLASLLSGSECRHCALGQPSFKEVTKEFEDRGYQLLEKEFVDTYKTLRFKCPNHPNHETRIALRKLRDGAGCKLCGIENSKKKKTTSFAEVKRKFNKCGYVLLATEYKDHNEKLKFICPKHPDKENSIEYKNLKRGRGCKWCGWERVSESRSLRKDIKEVKKEFSERQYELLERRFVNGSRKMKYRCLKHPNQTLSMTYNNFVGGQGCPYCWDERRRGSTSAAWMGGVTTLNNYLREKLSDWKFESLKNYNFRCAIKGTKRNLQVHHPKPFTLIRDEAIEKLGFVVKPEVGDYTEEELKRITDEVLREHEKIPGVPLEKEVHKLFHRIYGYETTFKDLYEFRERYLSREFEEVEQKTEQLNLFN